MLDTARLGSAKETEQRAGEGVALPIGKLAGVVMVLCSLLGVAALAVCATEASWGTVGVVGTDAVE